LVCQPVNRDELGKIGYRVQGGEDRAPADKRADGSIDHDGYRSPTFSRRLLRSSAEFLFETRLRRGSMRPTELAEVKTWKKPYSAGKKY
jgi:hypothetical protein